jgi:hypothetical protein
LSLLLCARPSGEVMIERSPPRRKEDKVFADRCLS